jgi:hypothetical protein
MGELKTACATIALAGALSGVAPAEVSLAQIAHWGGSVNSVRVIGDVVYAGVGGRLVALDVSDPSHPTRLG